MATCSFVTFNGSAELEGTRAPDFVKPSTKAYLGSSIVRGVTCWHSGEPPAIGDLSALLQTERSLDYRCGDGPSIPLPLEGGGSALRGVEAKAAAMSWPSSVCRCLYISARGRFTNIVGGFWPCNANFSTCKKRNKESPRSQQIDLSCLSLNKTVPLLFAAPLILGCNLMLSGLFTLEGRGHFLCLLCKKQKKDKKAHNDKENVVLEVRQLREPMEELLIGQLDPLALGLFAYVHYLGHEGWDRLRTIIFP
ncbi:hypothetical protein Cgig2_004347 [Carnegiea gigantea]|uniref:Uncharacterized protein n=1 Tax=Carnegiea gigantea TaxID=171969 RepID=A0A9Q1JZ09_9CARY|nr:hypothetical protein Cgig2_004347 [Carnegiea gigantea]